MAARPLAVILASADLERLYTGLSLLVSAAAEGRDASALATFGALASLSDPRLADRARRPDCTPHLSGPGRETFARSLAELRDTAADLPSCRLYACSAAAQTTGADVSSLDGVRSTPRFLRDAADAQLVVV